MHEDILDWDQEDLVETGIDPEYSERMTTKEDFEASIFEAIRNAEKSGFEIITDKEYSILLDLDNDESLAHYESIKKIAEDKFAYIEVNRWKSKDGGTHIVGNVSEVYSKTERLLIQACLGSDRKRELLALYRLVIECDIISVLFRPGKK